MLGPARTPFSINNISVVVYGPQVVTMTTRCCFWYEKVNGVIILRHLLNVFTAELSLPYSFCLGYTIIVYEKAPHQYHCFPRSWCIVAIGHHIRLLNCLLLSLFTSSLHSFLSLVVLWLSFTMSQAVFTISETKCYAPFTINSAIEVSSSFTFLFTS